MKIVVTDVTRMAGDACCVAGAGVNSGRRIRPVLPGGQQLGRDLLGPDGPFELGAVVDLGTVQNVGSAPMVEDRLFDPESAIGTRVLTPDGFWEILRTGSSTRLRSIFGNSLRQPRTGNAAIPVGEGRASLGLLDPTDPPELVINEYGRLRMHLTDGVLTLDTAVTDLRFFDRADDPRPGVVERIAERLQEGVGCILSVGLGRPYQAPNDTQRRHWFQVNGIHLADDPLWSVSAR